MYSAHKKLFTNNVLSFYKKHGRHDLPWRKTRDPYRILVSEIMLQQTQVARVIPKYNLFIKKFPSLKKLALASQKDVLVLWTGLGYNRRARFLHQATRFVLQQYGGIFPKTEKELRSLPGVGSYTAGAILAFAYNKHSYIIETNIRTVFIHHFFKSKKTVSDKEILFLVKETLPSKNLREWYFALMDYGAFLKSHGSLVHRKSSTYKTQTPFASSLRKIRGLILKRLVKSSCSKHTLKKEFGARTEEAVESLVKDGLVRTEKGAASLS